jgi:hypothetical protein
MIEDFRNYVKEVGKYQNGNSGAWTNNPASNGGTVGGGTGGTPGGGGTNPGGGDDGGGGTQGMCIKTGGTP